MKHINVTQGTAHPVESAAYPVDVAELAAARVVMVVWPEQGEPWIERDPFAGSERPADLLAIAADLMAQAEAQHTAPPTLEEARAAKAAEIEAARLADEAQGITLDGIRYAGDPGNRQALREALEYAEAVALVKFPSWKTSDGQFIADHPVSAVRSAYEQIGARRSVLITQEGERQAQIAAATTLADLESIAW